LSPPPTTIRRYCIRIAKHAECTRFWAAAHVDVFAFVYAATHGEPVAPLAPPRVSDAMEDVVFHDDDLTDPSFVVHVLQRVFDIPEHDASDLGLVVRSSGSAVIATLPAAEARDRRERALALARKESFPLRITVRPRRDPWWTRR